MDPLNKPGYKQTELGWIPEDWVILRFGEICSPSKVKMNPLNSESQKCVELENLSQGTGRILGVSDSKDSLSLKTVFLKGDILLGKLRPYLRKYLFADFEGVCSTEIWALKSNRNIYNRFTFYLAQNDKIIEAANLSTGTKMPRAEWKTVSETLIPLPPTLSEQTAIATALSDMDGYIGSLEKLIAKKRMIKQGAMQELLTPKEDWEVKKLGEIISNNQLGGNYSNSLNESNYPLIKMGNIKRGKISLEKIEYISIGFIPKSIDKLQEGDFLFNTRNTLELVGKVSVWRNELRDAYFNSNIMKITFKKEFVSSSFFMNYLFNTSTMISSLKDIATGTTSVAAIYTRDLFQIDISIPNLNFQILAANILNELHNENLILEKKLKKAQQLKQGMMQELLTGRTRLV